MILAEESTWPADENITMIIPAKAGGVNDTIARLMQEYFQNKLDAVVVVTNYDTKAVAYDAVHSAKNDGYTLMLQHSTLFAEAAGGNVALSEKSAHWENLRTLHRRMRHTIHFLNWLNTRRRTRAR